MSTAGFHITEDCAEVYLQNESGMEFLQLAKQLHDYLRQEQRLPARSLFEATDDVAPTCGSIAGHGKRRKRTAAGEFRQREKPQAAKQDKAAGSCAPRGGHICPPCGQFRGFTRGLLRGQK